MIVHYQSTGNGARFLSAKRLTLKMGLSLSSECQYWRGGPGLWRQTVSRPRGSHMKRTVTEGGPTSWRHQQRRWVDRATGRWQPLLSTRLAVPSQRDQPLSWYQIISIYRPWIRYAWLSGLSSYSALRTCPKFRMLFLTWLFCTTTDTYAACPLRAPDTAPGHATPAFNEQTWTLWHHVYTDTRLLTNQSVSQTDTWAALP